MVRSPDAVMGIGFIVIFPLTFISNAFVPIASMPEALQWVASVNPVSVLVAAVRTSGAALVLVTHEPRLAAYSDREVLVRDGRTSQSPVPA